MKKKIPSRKFPKRPAGKPLNPVEPSAMEGTREERLEALKAKLKDKLKTIGDA